VGPAKPYSQAEVEFADQFRLQLLEAFKS